MRRAPLVSAVAGVALLFVTTTSADAVCEEPPIRVAEELARAISAYATHTGELPGTVEALTAVVTNAHGVSAGPFIQRWGAWRRFHYEGRGRRFRITSGFAGGRLTLIGHNGAYDIEIEREWCGAP